MYIVAIFHHKIYALAMWKIVIKLTAKDERQYAEKWCLGMLLISLEKSRTRCIRKKLNNPVLVYRNNKTPK